MTTAVVGHGVRASRWDRGYQKNSGCGEPEEQEGALGCGSLRVLRIHVHGASVWLQSALGHGSSGAAGEMIPGGILYLVDFGRCSFHSVPDRKHAECASGVSPLLRKVSHQRGSRQGNPFHHKSYCNPGQQSPAFHRHKRSDPSTTNPVSASRWFFSPRPEEK